VFKLICFSILFVVCTSVIGTELGDPTRPMGYHEAQLSKSASDSGEEYLPLKVGLDPQKFKLQGIFIAKSGNSAILNGRRVRLGDSLNNTKLIEIEPGHIVLDGYGEHLKIELLPLMVKKPTPPAAGEK